MNHYWNNIDAEVEDGVVIVDSGGVDINSVHPKTNLYLLCISDNFL